MSIGKIIYGTNRNLLDYEFKIIKEFDTYYEVRDVSTSDFEQGKNIFHVNKDPLEFTYSTDKRWEFMYKDKGFKISFDKKDIIRYATELQIEACESNLTSYHENISVIKQELNKLNNVTEYEGYIDKFLSLTYNDTAIAKYYNTELKLTVAAICTKSSGDSLPIFTVNDESELLIPKFDTYHKCYYIDYNDIGYLIYIDREHIERTEQYKIKLQLIDRLADIRRLIVDYKSRLQKLKDLLTEN